MKTIHTLAMVLAIMFAPCLPSRAQDAVVERPLPKIDDVFLKRVGERAMLEDENDREFKLRYTYKRSTEKKTTNDKGELKSREQKRKLHIPRVSLPEDEAEDEKVEASVDSQSVTNTLKTGRGKAFSKSDLALTDEILSRFEFTLIGRETLQGRPALVIDFRPADRKLPENSLKEKFLNKARGRVWVDEEEYALVKADAHLSDHVNVVGGLVGVVRKFNYKLTRERTEDGYWFARTTGWHLEGRQVLVSRIIDYHDEKQDVKRYRLTAQANEDVTTR